MVNSITFSHAAASLGYESVPVVYHNYLVIEETVGSFTKDNKLLCASNYHCGVLGKSSIARNRLPYIVRFHIIEQAIWQVYFVRDLHKVNDPSIFHNSKLHFFEAMCITDYWQTTMPTTG